MKASISIAFVAGLMVFASLAKAEDTFVIADGPYKPTWESLKQYECPDWFRDAKFGIWAHWGVQCQPEMGDWYAWHMYRPALGSPIYKFHCAIYGHPSVFGLKDLCNAWKADVTWDVRVGKPGSYTVEIEYGCPNQCAGSEYTIEVDGQTLTYTVGPTGDWEKFKKGKAGVLNLTQAGVQTLTLRPTKGKWHKAMNVRSVTLSP